MKQVSYNGLTFEPFIEREKIQARILELAREITEQYRGRRPLLVCVLNGAFPFAAELFLNIDTDAEISFIRLKSYEGTSSTGTVKEIMGLQDDIEGRPVILVEDIVDTGQTIKRLVDTESAKNPHTAFQAREPAVRRKARLRGLLNRPEIHHRFRSGPRRPGPQPPGHLRAQGTGRLTCAGPAPFPSPLLYNFK